MSSQFDQLETILDEAKKHERRARQRTLLYSLIPIILAGILLGYTIWQIKTAQYSLNEVEGELLDTQTELVEINTEFEEKQAELQVANTLIAETQNQLDEKTALLETVQEELKSTQLQVEDLKLQLETLNEDIDSAEEQLRQYREAGTFEPHLCYLEPRQVKETPYDLFWLYSAKHARVYETLTYDSYRGIYFSINGASVEEGFNSPNYAIHILQQNDLLPTNYDANKRLWEQLTQISSPAMGDLVYYRSGYTMFYYKYEDQECVIGMTPAGVLSLTPDFSEVAGYLKVPYP